MLPTSPRLHVCHVMSADLWAGAEVQVRTLISYLAEQDDMRVSAVLFNDGWLAGELRRMGVELAIADERTHNAAAIVRFLVRFLRTRSVDVVHTHRYKDNILGSIAAKLAAVPHVVRTVHGLPEPTTGWRRVHSGACQALDRAMLSWSADATVAVSRHSAAILAGAGFRRVTEVHNGIDLESVRIGVPPSAVRAGLGIAAGEFLVGSAGRFAPVKGHEHLVRAASLIRDRLPCARFLFVGSGALENHLRGLAGRLGVGAACLFVDPLVDRRAAVHDLMRAMDVFVLPSLSEGIPMALLEAMALGRPVVASNVGGVPEIVTNGSNGLLTSAASESELADACMKLAKDRSWAASLGARAEQTVCERFTRERNGSSMVQLYRRVARPVYLTVPPPSITAAALFVAPVRAALRCARRRALSALERRRAARARRRPAAILTALRSARNVLVVCHGNIIRSAYAAKRLQQTFAQGAGISIRSAGLAAVAGRAADPTAMSVAAPRADLTDHSATPLTSALVAWADVILVMDVPQVIELRARFPEGRGKTILLSAIAPGSPLEVKDPFDHGTDAVRTCFDHIDRSVAAVADAIAPSDDDAINQAPHRRSHFRLALR